MPAETGDAGSVDKWQEWIQAAHQGSKEALGQLFEACRNYLLLVANEQLGSELKGKVGASDIVQETCVKAQREFDRFYGRTEVELLAWLRKILLNSIANVKRAYHGTGKRRLSNEVPLTDAVAATQNTSSASAIQPPDAQLIALEEDLQLEHALEQLPEIYRQVIHWRNWERRSFEAIGEQLGRSAEAARKLWGRAIEQLQEILEPSDASQ